MWTWPEVAALAIGAAETAEVGEPVAWMTVNDDGDPAMLFFDHAEAMSYCNDGEVPIELFTASQLAAAVAGREKLDTAIREAIKYLGPAAPDCSGCEYEWSMALRVLREAVNTEGGTS